MEPITCGFAILPGNDHCWLGDICRVCKVTRLEAAKDIIESFAPEEET